jgi:hypothetical protein
MDRSAGREGLGVAQATADGSKPMWRFARLDPLRTGRYALVRVESSVAAASRFSHGNRFPAAALWPNVHTTESSRFFRRNRLVRPTRMTPNKSEVGRGEALDPPSVFAGLSARSPSSTGTTLPLPRARPRPSEGRAPTHRRTPRPRWREAVQPGQNGLLHPGLARLG